MMDNDGLDDFFRQARVSDPAPSDRLMARVLADAAAVQAEAARLARPGVALPRPGWLAQVVSLFGGTGALAGLATAAVAGVAVGFVQPAALAPWSGGLWSAVAVDTVELFPDTDTFLADTEG